MNTALFIQCLICGMLGILFHLLIKVKSLRKRAKAANKEFSISDYLRQDWITIMISVVTVIIFIVILPEILSYKPWLQNWIRVLFVFAGFTGSSVLQSFLSKTEKQILDVIDKKTNIADGIDSK